MEIESIGKGRVLGRVPGDREVKRGSKAAAQRNQAGEEHGAAGRYKQGAQSEPTGQVTEVDSS
jgi:hypothetical protein